MARVRPFVVARNLTGRVVPDAEIYVYERDDTEVVADHAKVEIDLYDAESAGVLLTQPLLTDARGIVEEFWMAPQSYDRRIKYTTDDYIVHDEGVSAQDLGGRELGYAEITTAASSTSTYTTFTDVADLSIDVVVATRPIIVEFGGYINNSTNSGGVIAAIREGSTVKAIALQLLSGNGSVPAMCRRRLTPTAGAHTYKVSLARIVAGTAEIGADATYPAWLQATEV